MKIFIRAIGKPHDPQIKKAIDDFSARIGHYYPLEWKIFPAKKITDQHEQMLAESELLLKNIGPDDFLVGLDEHGKQMTSPALAAFIEKQSIQSVKNLIFIIGGAFGLHQHLLKRCNFIWSLSELTFPHQLVRLILAEQIYRACTIIRNEKYHHS